MRRIPTSRQRSQCDHFVDCGNGSRPGHWRIRVRSRGISRLISNAFRELTTGHHLLIGRKTYASIGRPLPQRTMIIITHDPDYEAPGCQVEHSVTAGIELARTSGEEELFVGGGAEIYAQCLDLADRIYADAGRYRLSGRYLLS